MERKCSITSSTSDISPSLQLLTEDCLRHTDAHVSSDDDVFINNDDQDNELYSFRRSNGNITLSNLATTSFPENRGTSETRVFKCERPRGVYSPYKKPRSLDGFPCHTCVDLSKPYSVYRTPEKPPGRQGFNHEGNSWNERKPVYSSSSINRVKKRLRFDIPFESDDTKERTFSFDRHRKCRSRSESDFKEYEERLTEEQRDTLIQNLMNQLRRRKHTLSHRYRWDGSIDTYPGQDSFDKQRSDKQDIFSQERLRSTYSEELVYPSDNKRDDSPCPCRRMEKQLMEMAGNAYKNIRRVDGSPTGFQQFQKELSETNVILRDSLNLLTDMKVYCRRVWGCQM